MVSSALVREGTAVSANSIDRLAVMFTALKGIADIARREGEMRSVDVLQQATDEFCALAAENAGEVVDVVAEELLILFKRADDALNCACRMHKLLGEAPTLRDAGLSLSLGIHYGVVYRKGEERVFGDTINTAARVKSQCQPGRILLTREAKITLHQKSLEIVHPFDRVEVKDKARPLTLFEAVWAPEDLNKTSVMSAMVDTGSLKDLSADQLELRVDGEKRTISSAMTPLTLGRGVQCYIPLDCPTASRLHCRIEHRRGKFVLVDSSTNGTHLMRSDGSTAILKREQAVLTGRGRFGLGADPEPGASGTLEFECD